MQKSLSGDIHRWIREEYVLGLMTDLLFHLFEWMLQRFAAHERWGWMKTLNVCFAFSSLCCTWETGSLKAVYCLCVGCYKSTVLLRYAPFTIAYFHWWRTKCCLSCKHFYYIRYVNLEVPWCCMDIITEVMAIIQSIILRWLPYTVACLQLRWEHVFQSILNERILSLWFVLTSEK